MIGNINNPYSFNPVSNSNINKNEDLSPAELRMKKRTGEIECSKCASRKYVDGSDDPGVSFKTPGKIDPKQSASKVMSHENEHVRNHSSEAASDENKESFSTVSLTWSNCPECGTSYVSGGTTTTTTTTQENEDNKSDAFNKLLDDTIGTTYGKFFDAKV